MDSALHTLERPPAPATDTLLPLPSPAESDSSGEDSDLGRRRRESSSSKTRDTSSQDYQKCEFLRKDLHQTWEANFCGPGPLPDGASRRRFVPRPLAFPKAERTPRADWIREAA